MHTVDRLEAALATARMRGYQIRLEWLGGGGGGCEINGQKWIFLDLALSPAEQLEQVLEALLDEASRQAHAAIPAPRKISA